MWIVNAYLLAYTVFVAAAGKFADRLGQRRMFMLGLLTFTGASVVCGLAPNSAVLIAARAVEGLGGAMMTPTSQAIVTNAYPKDERGRALGIYAGVSALGVAMGPLLGGVLTTFAGWEWIFFVNIPVGLAAFFLTRYADPAQDRAQDSEPVDWLGLAALIMGLSLFTIAIMESNTWGLSSPSFIETFIGGTALMAAFVWIELRKEYPLLQLRIFKNRDFTADNIVNFFVRFALFGLSVYGPIFVQDVLGFSAFEAGAATLPGFRLQRLYERKSELDIKPPGIQVSRQAQVPEPDLLKRFELIDSIFGGRPLRIAVGGERMVRFTTRSIETATVSSRIRRGPSPY